MVTICSDDTWTFGSGGAFLMPFRRLRSSRLRNATADFGQKQLDHVALVGMGIGPGGKPASETGAKLLGSGPHPGPKV